MSAINLALDRHPADLTDCPPLHISYSPGDRKYM